MSKIEISKVLILKVLRDLILDPIDGIKPLAPDYEKTLCYVVEHYDEAVFNLQIEAINLNGNFVFSSDDKLNDLILGEYQNKLRKLVNQIYLEINDLEIDYAITSKNIINELVN